MTTTVLFDFDMTLVNSAPAITRCLNMVAREGHLRVVTEEEVLATIGLPMEDALARLWGSYEPRWLDMYRERCREVEYAGLLVFDDAVPTLRTLRERGCRTGVVSNRRFARPVVECVALDALCDVVVGLEDIARPKPFPDALEHALAVLGAAAEEALYVGDTDVDMRTAVAAGVRGVGITTGAFGAPELFAAGAWCTVDCLQEVTELP